MIDTCYLCRKLSLAYRLFHIISGWLWLCGRACKVRSQYWVYDSFLGCSNMCGLSTRMGICRHFLSQAQGCDGLWSLVDITIHGYGLRFLTISRQLAVQAARGAGSSRCRQLAVRQVFQLMVLFCSDMCACCWITYNKSTISELLQCGGWLIGSLCSMLTASMTSHANLCVTYRSVTIDAMDNG